MGEEGLWEGRADLPYYESDLAGRGSRRSRMTAARTHGAMATATALCGDDAYVTHTCSLLVK